jgi:hypothetical protein
LEISSINLIKVLSSSRLHFSCSRSTSNGNISVDLQSREETDHEESEFNWKKHNLNNSLEAEKAR